MSAANTRGARDGGTGPASVGALGVDAGRMMRRIEALAAVDRRDDGSCCRLALTDSDRAGRDLLVSWMKDAGLDVRIDPIGNIIGLRAGRQYGAPVMTGSHIDTVATGGRFDGVLGVCAGLEVVETLNDAGILTERPLALVVFTNEEGVRFQPDMMGSLVFAGGLPLEEALAATSPEGVTLAAELHRGGYAGAAPCGEPRPHAYVELHIEQGPVLDRAEEVLGSVADLQGISWQELTIRGVSNHAGTTPMDLRRDAGFCAAAVAVFVRELAQRMGGAQVATVGQMQLSPNLVNVIAREARLSVDLRNTDDLRLQAAEAELTDFLALLALREGVTIESRPLARTEPVVFDLDVLTVIEAVAADLGQPIRRMTSGAGHDAQMIARIAPAAMIFVPSIGGVSHNPREDTRIEHLEIGANVLLHTMLRLAAEPGA
ncbi:Zn-dependent hydrolase [Phenylobacterium sp.]|uniref:Zn-dependent hydrolase n=1 Tax=Phenylobacterium sp. TaxID=1871053 RepID=UPI00356808BF